MNHCVFPEILRMQSYTKKHYWEDISVEDIAGSVGYSPRRGNLLFRECFGETLGSYLRYLRMEDARRLLNNQILIDRVALSLSYTPRGFRKAFQEYFGVSPSQYVKTGRSYERYSKTYEYEPDGIWGEGKNPTPDGLWEFSCFDPVAKEYLPMEWCASSGFFQSPLGSVITSPQWHCRNREGGYGMHPGRATHAVKTFICPQDGTVDVFFSVGRNRPFRAMYNGSWYSWKTPCSARLYLNDVPLGNEAVMTTVDPVFRTATCTVRAGDKIRLHIDPMGDHVSDGVFLYRQKIAYRNDTEHPDGTL